MLERSVLVCIHIREVPNKVGFAGIFQPFRDAIRFHLFSISLMIFLLFLFVSFFVGLFISSLLERFSFLCWVCFLWFFTRLGCLYCYSCWVASNSGYSLLSVPRALARTVSSEVRLG